MFLVTRFKHIIDCAYSYKEALERENLKQESVNRLREKVKTSKFVPKFIVDQQVTYAKRVGLPKIYLILFEAIAISERWQRRRREELEDHSQLLQNKEIEPAVFCEPRCDF